MSPKIKEVSAKKVETKVSVKEATPRITISFITPKRGEDATEGEAANNTKFIYGYLRKSFDDSTFDTEKGTTVCAGYAIRYSGDSYKIVSKVTGKLGTAVPDPKSVLEYLKANPAPTKREMTPDEEAKATLAGKLAKNFAVKASEAPADDDTLKLTPGSKKILNVAQAILDGVKEEVYGLGKVKQLIEKIVDPEMPKFTHLVEHVKSFMSEKITFEECEKLFKAEIEPMLEVVRQKAAKFDGLVEVRFLNNGTISIDKAGHVTGQIEVDEVVTDVSMSRFEILVNIILSRFPKAMPLIMKLAQGKEEFDGKSLITPEVLFSKRFVDDSYEPYDEKVLAESKHKAAVENVCSLILGYHGIPTPYRIHFDNTIERGTKVRVQWSDYYAFFDGIVTSTKYGLKVTYAVGPHLPIAKGQKFEVIGEATPEEMEKSEATVKEEKAATPAE